MTQEARLGLLAMLVSAMTLGRGVSPKRYQDNIKSLLNNPQWRKAMSRDDPRS